MLRKPAIAFTFVASMLAVQDTSAEPVMFDPTFSYNDLMYHVNSDGLIAYYQGRERLSDLRS